MCSSDLIDLRSLGLVGEAGLGADGGGVGRGAAKAALEVEVDEELLEGVSGGVHNVLHLRTVDAREAGHGLDLLGEVEEVVVGVVHILQPLVLVHGEQLGCKLGRIILVTNPA